MSRIDLKSPFTKNYDGRVRCIMVKCKNVPDETPTENEINLVAVHVGKNTFRVYLKR
jgi:hypothetical protein